MGDGKPGPRQGVHVLCGIPQPHDADAESPPHAPHERLQQEARKPHASISLYFMAYNFVHVHQTPTKAAKGMHTTPAMAAGVTDHVWKVSEIVQPFSIQTDPMPICRCMQRRGTVPELCPHRREPSTNTKGPPLGDPSVNTVSASTSTIIDKHQSQAFTNPKSCASASSATFARVETSVSRATYTTLAATVRAVLRRAGRKPHVSAGSQAVGRVRLPVLRGRGFAVLSEVRRCRTVVGQGTR